MTFHCVTNYPYKIITPPTGDPLFVSLEDARTYLKVDVDNISDDDLTALIKAAQDAGERYTKLTFFNTEFLAQFDFFCDEIVLRRAPLNSINSISRQIDDVDVLVDSDIYKIIDENQINYGSVAIKANQNFPNDFDNEKRIIQIQFVAGFGEDATFLPNDLILGLLRLLADYYEDKGDCSCNGILDSTIPKSARMLLMPFRIMEIH